MTLPRHGAGPRTTVMQNNASSSTCLRHDATRVRRTSTMKTAYLSAQSPTVFTL